MGKQDEVVVLREWADDKRGCQRRCLGHEGASSLRCSVGGKSTTFGSSDFRRHVGN